MTRIDAAAEAANMTRAEWMRWACDVALSAPRTAEKDSPRSP